MADQENVSVITGFGKRMAVEYQDFGVAGAILEIDAGKKTDMVFHCINGLLLYILVGKLRVSVLKDGIINGVNVQAGASFYVKPGLVYQMEAIEKSMVVEFGYSDTLKTDITCISKGTQLPPPPAPTPDPVVPVPAADPTPVVEVTPEPVVVPDLVPAVEPDPEPVEELSKRKSSKKKGGKGKKLN